MAFHADPSLPDGKPIVGDMVHFVVDGDICCAGTVMKVDSVDPYKINVTYFMPDGGEYWQLNVDADLDNLTVGTWHAMGAN